MENHKVEETGQPSILSGELVFRPTWLMVFGWLFGIAVLVSLVYFILHFNDIELFFSLIRKANPVWFAGALVCQLMTYVAAAMVWKAAFKNVRDRIPFTALLKIGFLQLFANQVLPTSGFSGTVVVLRALTARGVDISAALSGLFLGALSYYAVYLALVVLTFALVWQRHLMGPDWLPLLAAFVLLVITLLLCLYVMSRLKDRILPRFLLQWRFAAYLAVWLQEMDPTPLRNASTVAQAAAYQCAVFLLDAATLWCVAHSIGISLDVVAALASFLVASVAATVAPLPLGLGSFESASIMALHLFGAGPEAGLAATLMLRGLTLWLPMLPGLWFTRSEVAHAIRAKHAS